jgi:hypothetical protein
MKSFKEFIKNNIDETGRCWDGYKPKAGKKSYAKDSCVKEHHVEELEDGLKQLHSHDYDTINNLMMKISKKNHISGKKLHDDFENKHGQIPDDWIKRNSKYVKEDGVGAGTAGGIAGPTNIVGGGAIAGTGGKGGEPGVNLKNKNKSLLKSPVVGIINRKSPKI